MAAAPPPYRPGGGPGAPDPRWQWKQQQQAVKAQQRIARDQWRAQRAYYSGWRRPSLVRPLLLIAIGIVALLIEANYISMYLFWDWYIHWWPVLLIALGLSLLGEWWLQRGDPYSQRTGVGGLVFLILLLAVLGVVGKHAVNSPFGWNFFNNDNNWAMHMWGQEHDADTQTDQAFGANGSLSIDNPRGDVSIAPSTDDRIHVSAHQTVYASSNREAQSILERLQPRLHVAGSTATLSTADIDRGSVDLTVQVPANSSVTLKAGGGNVALSGLNGTVAVNAGRGNVTLNKIGGACTAQMAGGDFSAHAITGRLDVKGRTGDANVSDVNGAVTLDGDFMGEVDIAKLGAPLNFHSTRTTFTVTRLNGDLLLDDDDLNIQNASGSIQAATRAKNIKVSQVAGPLDLRTSDGDIEVDLNGGAGPIVLNNRNGDITLGLPADARFAVNATANDGGITSKLTFAGGQHSDHAMTGTTGSGAAVTPVTLVAEHGDIEIRRATAGNSDEDDTPEAPEKPEPPERPEAVAAPTAPRPPKVPHLHVPAGQTAPQTSAN